MPTLAKPFPKPIDLLQGPEDFPIDAFPPSVERFCRSAARALPVPIDLVAVPVLVTAGAAIGLSRVAQLKSSHIEHAALFAAIVASPGHKKSPALRLVTTPTWDREHEAEADWRCARDAAEQPGGSEDAPPRQHFALTDATTEALIEVLSENPRGVLNSHDELSGWIKGMDQYRPQGKGADLQTWLKIYSGVPFTVKRVRRDALHVARPFVSVLGGIQPDVLQDLSSGRKDGFLDRVLFAFPRAQPFATSREELPGRDTGAWTRVVRTLYSLELEPDGGPFPTPFTADAREAFFDWHEALMGQAREGETPEHLDGFLGKAEGLAMRFALILELMRWADGSSETSGRAISVRSVVDAGRLFQYFLAHQQRVREHIGARPEEHRLEQFSRWMDRRGKARFTLREVQNAKVAGCRTKHDVRDLFRLAEAHDIGERRSISHQSGGSSEGFERHA